MPGCGHLEGPAPCGDDNTGHYRILAAWSSAYVSLLPRTRAYQTSRPGGGQLPRISLLKLSEKGYEHYFDRGFGAECGGQNGLIVP
jgi:hypothetical protein